MKLTKNNFNFSFALLVILFNINVNANRVYSNFNKCSKNYTDEKLLQTNEGKIRGDCYSVPVSYSNNKKVFNEVFAWLSVPFAEPPTNENRFKDPIPKKPFNTIIDGSVWPNACMQFGNLNSSEDCLYLNIFAPSNAYLYKKIRSALVPILVFIHGGSFVVGRASDDRFDASTLVSHSNMIVVTIQYRLDSFGFLHLSDSAAFGNQGFLDQSLALKWIYENADKFGCDRNKITISGESAGSFSIGMKKF